MLPNFSFGERRACLNLKYPVQIRIKPINIYPGSPRENGYNP